MHTYLTQKGASPCNQKWQSGLWTNGFSGVLANIKTLSRKGKNTKENNGPKWLKKDEQKWVDNGFIIFIFEWVCILYILYLNSTINFYQIVTFHLHWPLITQQIQFNIIPFIKKKRKKTKLNKQAPSYLTGLLHNLCSSGGHILSIPTLTNGLGEWFL